MARRRPPIARPAALFAVAALLAGCAEMHRGAEAVGRIGGTSAPASDVAEDDVAPARPAVKTVRPRGAPRAPAPDLSLRESAPAPAVVATAVPSPRQIFDFHPAGSRPDSWRQPFVIDTRDGPLAADVRRSSAELKAFMAEHRAGDARAAPAEAARVDGGKVDGTATATARKRCSEADVATAKPGCGVPRPQAAAAAPVP